MEQPTLSTIRCARCKQVLPPDAFAPSHRKNGDYCRTCRATYMREWAQRPGSVKYREHKRYKPPRPVRLEQLELLAGAEAITCGRCRHVKAASEFTPGSRKQGGYCQPCQAWYMREYKRRKALGLPPPGRPSRTYEIIINPRTGRPMGKAWDALRKTVIAAADACAICGEVVDKSLQWNDPLAPTVDHIVPLALGGHPSDPTNLQLAHRSCNARDGARVGGKLAAERLIFARVAIEWARLAAF